MDQEDWGWRKGSISHEAKCCRDRKEISYVVSRLPFTLIISFGRYRSIKIGRKWKVERTNESTLFFLYMRMKIEKVWENDMKIWAGVNERWQGTFKWNWRAYNCGENLQVFMYFLNNTGSMSKKSETSVTGRYKHKGIKISVKW